MFLVMAVNLIFQLGYNKNVETPQFEKRCVGIQIHKL